MCIILKTKNKGSDEAKKKKKERNTSSVFQKSGQ